MLRVKTIIAGSRFDEHDRPTVDKWWREANHAIEGFHLAATISEVVSGTARGADRLGERWARENGIPVSSCPADWTTFGKRAGFIRNQEMAAYADALIALWDGQSKGTEHMIDTARRRGLLVLVWRV